MLDTGNVREEQHVAEVKVPSTCDVTASPTYKVLGHASNVLYEASVHSLTPSCLKYVVKTLSVRVIRSQYASSDEAEYGPTDVV